MGRQWETVTESVPFSSDRICRYFIMELSVQEIFSILGHYVLYHVTDGG